MSEESLYRNQIEATFFEARNLPASEQSAFLDLACRGNENLRHAVKDLLDADANAGKFFDTPINLEDTSHLPAAEYEGATVGRYELLQKLGEGGFGVVFMAEQSEPVRRKVAVKIIKPGMDSRAVIARFEAERQALAMMNHPNVASVLDGGTTDSGRPFFVMELIRGVAITEYCKKKRLGTKGRLRLFVDVCKAVQHAHQNGIIHRDVKPSNVMVTLHDGRPVVKVIDFGVAKAVNQHLTGKTLFTRYGQMIGTPQYMSPEQAEMSALDVDTRSDIYSLGVLLYELLTDSTPLTEQRLRQATYVEMQRIICEEELPKPSVRLSTTSTQEVSDLAEKRGVSSLHLRKEIPDELDCIVMKTLEKERNRRYRTAIELADDINRYINDEAVEARPPSVSYRVTKYVRKNRLFVGAAAAIATILLLSTMTSSGLAWWAVAEKSVADDALGAERRALKNLEESKSLLEEQTDALIDKIYEALFIRAIAAYDNGYLGQAKASLAECPETSRGWEWSRQNYLSNSRNYVTIPPSPYGVFTNDSRFLITCGGGDAPNEINTWSVDTGERRHTISVGVHELTRIAIHPGGRIVTVGDVRGGITAVDVLSDGVLWTTSAHAKGVAGIAYSPDGKRIATVANEKFLKIWDADSGKLLASHEYDGRLWGVEFDATGTLLLTNALKTSSMREARTALIVDSQTGDVVSRVDEIGRSANGTTFHPDGKRIATGDDECVIVRRTRDRRVEQVLSGGRGHWGNDNCSPMYSPDGRWVAAPSGGVVLLWDTSTGRIVKKLAGDHSVAFLGSFSPDSTKVSLLARREGGGLESEIRVYDVSGRSGKGGLLLSGTHEGALCVAFSPDSSRVAAAGVERSIRIWDCRTCEETNVLHGHADAIWRMAWSVDGQVLFSHDHAGFLRAWDIRNGTCRWVVRTVPEAGDFRDFPNVNGLVVTPDGKRVLLSWINGETIVFDAQSGKEKTRLSGRGEGNINGVACSTDGEWIATGSDDGSIVIWDGNTLKKCRVLDGHTESVRAVAFAPDNKSVASGSYDGTVRVWDRESGKEISTLRGHQFGVWSLEFSADGRRLFSADGPGLIIVWDLERGREIYRLRHENYGHRLDVSPDGSTVVTASAFGDVRLWETVLPEADTLQKRRLFELARQAVDKADQPVAFASEKAKRIEADRTLVDEVREAALRLITVRGDDPYALNRASWEIVRDGRVEAFQLALDQAKRAWELAPDCSDYAITTGVAHFRLGQLQECVNVLNQAEANLLPDALSWSDDPRIDLRPYLYATLARAHHQLGKTELAEKAFDAAKQHRRSQRDPNIDAYFRDAEASLHSNPLESQGQ